MGDRDGENKQDDELHEILAKYTEYGERGRSSGSGDRRVRVSERGDRDFTEQAPMSA